MYLLCFISCFCTLGWLWLVCDIYLFLGNVIIEVLDEFASNQTVKLTKGYHLVCNGAVPSVTRLFDTVLVLIKLTYFAVALRLRCGSC